MARAKKTDRAEARRRYRLSEGLDMTPDALPAEPSKPSGFVRALHTALPILPDPTEPAPAPVAPVRKAQNGRREQPRGAMPAPAKESLGYRNLYEALRGSLQKPDFQQDIYWFPAVATRTLSLIVPGGLVAIVGILMLIPATSTNEYVLKLGGFLVSPPSAAMTFLAGLIAPRSSWLVGGIVGAIASIFCIAWLLVVPDANLGFSGFTDKSIEILYAAVFSPVAGLAIGAFAGYYKRVLAAQNKRGRAQRRNSKGR